MWGCFCKRMSVTAAIALMSLLVFSANSAVAQDHDFILPAGQACDFELAIDVAGGDKQVFREFVDADGNVVRTLIAGVGFQLTFTNLSNDETITFRANGAATRTVLNADGIQTVTSTGHNLLILFPTDVPAGPSTTIYVGRVVFTVDESGTYTLVSTSGKATDICAALS